MKKDFGGAVFPVFDSVRAGEAYGCCDSGMTLRDWFAGQAIVGLLASGGLQDVTSEGFARRAYGVADAMIAEWTKEANT